MAAAATADVVVFGEVRSEHDSPLDHMFTIVTRYFPSHKIVLLHNLSGFKAARRVVPYGIHVRHTVCLVEILNQTTHV
jgi:hypothetical protein